MRALPFRVRLASAALALAALASTPAAQERQRPTFWDAESIAARAVGPNAHLARQGRYVASVPLTRIQNLVDAKQAIVQASGVGAQLLLSDLGMPRPNAFASRTDKGDFVVMNLAMLELMGDDVDAVAAVVGHEFAHITLNHRESRRGREEVRRGVSTVLGIALGLAGVPMGGTLSDIATSAVAHTYSRDEEREADEKGMRYAAAAGYSVEGGVRAWERMARAGGGGVPFLATHPAQEERLETMRLLSKSIQPDGKAPTPGRVAAVPKGDPAAWDALLASAESGASGRRAMHGATFAQVESGTIFVLAHAGSLLPGDAVYFCSDAAGGRALEHLGQLEDCRVPDKPGMLGLRVFRGGAWVDAEVETPAGPSIE